MAIPFLRSKKRKKETKGKKRVSKQKLLKGYRQGENSIALTILERLEFENISCRPTMAVDKTFQCSMPHFADPERDLKIQ